MKFLLMTLLMTIPSVGKSEVIQLTTQNTVVFRGPVDGASTTNVQVKLQELSELRGNKTYPIYLVLDSPGGSIMAGLAFIDFAKTIPNLHTISMFAASMASGIVEALPGKRYVTGTGILMFHRARGSFEGQFEEGEVEQELKLFKAIVRGMEQTNADRLGLSLEAYKDKVKDEMWVYAKDAVTAKAADAVIDISCTKELIAKREIAFVADLFGSVGLEFSGCPLFRAPIKVNRDSGE